MALFAAGAAALAVDAVLWGLAVRAHRRKQMGLAVAPALSRGGTGLVVAARF